MFGIFGGDKKQVDRAKAAVSPSKNGPNNGSTQKEINSSPGAPPMTKNAVSSSQPQQPQSEQKDTRKVSVTSTVTRNALSPSVTHDEVGERETLPRNLLLISSKRPRTFYERAARELLASGNQEIMLSALGDAAPTAIHLAASLQEKKAVIIKKAGSIGLD